MHQWLPQRHYLRSPRRQQLRLRGVLHLRQRLNHPDHPPDQVNHCASLVYFPGYLYALHGDSKKDFWRYSVAQNTWQSLGSVSWSVKEGGSLASLGGEHIFASRGSGKDDFRRYGISADQCGSLTDTPDKINDGGSLVPLDDRLYAPWRDNKKKFWELAASE